jgi:hypothetical protein
VLQVILGLSTLRGLTIVTGKGNELADEEVEQLASQAFIQVSA